MEPEELQPLEKAEEAALNVAPAEGVAEVVEDVPEEVPVAEGVTDAVEDATAAAVESRVELPVAEGVTDVVEDVPESLPSADGVTDTVEDATGAVVEPAVESTDESTVAKGVMDTVKDATDAVVESTDEVPVTEGVTDVVEDGPEETVEPAAEEVPATEDEESGEEAEPVPMVFSDVELKAILQAVIYITDEPLESRQMALALQQPIERVDAALAVLVEEFSRPESGLQIREIAGGFKMATKPEHHEAVRQFVKNLKPSFKLTPAALETLAVIAYKQPITAPEIMEIRGVQGAGVLKTLVERKLITTAGRKSVIGKPILYKTTKDFLVQFGLKSVNELPTLKEFEELRRLAFSEDEMPAEEAEGPTSVAEAAAVKAEPIPDSAEKA